MIATIIPNLAGLKLLRVWRLEDGDFAPEVLPVIAFAVKDSEESPVAILPSGREQIDDNMNERTGAAWATAILDSDGGVVDSYGTIFASQDSYVEALRRRDTKKNQTDKRG